MTNRPVALARMAALLLGFFFALAAAADVSVTPITWDVVGLDHNRPLTSGPELFPVGARVCTDSATSNAEVALIWEEANAFIGTRPGSLTSLQTGPLGAGECFDAYFEIQLTRSASAFGESRLYRIDATDADTSLTFSSPTPRAIYIEQLVSQNRNSTTQIRWGQQADGSDWVILGAGGGLNLAVGETYFIELTTETATAYEQLQSFLTLSNTIFQVKSVETTYGVKTAPDSRVPVPNPRLYADGCLWDPDPNSPNYLSCLSDGKAGGEVVTIYEIDIISGGGDSVGLEALIYDKSGGSFHYNTDFSQSPGDLNTYDPAASGFAKRFFPDTISVGATSRLVLTITNPNPVELGGHNFIDNLPAGVEVAATPNASTTCGGIWNPLPGDTSLAFDIDTGVIGANSTCSVIVDVSAAVEGTYDNVSENLFIGDFDTGLQAIDQLIVTNLPPPPACVPGTTHSTWTMEPGAGTGVPPLPTTVYSGDNLDAVASYTALAGGSQFIETADGQPANAWGGIGWAVATAPDNSVGPGPNDASWFEFQLDTTEFSTDPTESMSFSLDMFPTPNGDWASNTNITMNVHVSTDGGATWSTILNDNTVGKTAWNTRSGGFTPGSGTTNVRVNVTGVKSGSEASAAVLLDNVLFSGCGPGTSGIVPNPPELAKAFSPPAIGAGEISTLTFTVTNPNAISPDDDLSGIDFTDNLPTGVEVAATPNESTTCGGTVTASAGDSVIALTDGALAANATCTVSVDVTSSSVATHVNISDFIYADESGQNNTPTGSGNDTLIVLAPPVIDKTFDPQLVLLGITPGNFSALVFTVANPNPFDPLGGIAFIDNLPADLTVAAVPNIITSGCGTPTISAPAGGTTIDFSSGTIAAGDVCVVSVDVEGPIGIYDNVSNNVSHIVGGVTVEGNNATAQLVVDEPIPAISMLKQVGLTSDPNGTWQNYLPVEVGTDVYYKLTVENIGELPLTNITVDDPAVDTSSCTWSASLPEADFGAPTAHIDECVIGPITISTPGEVPNTATTFGDYSLVSPPLAGTISGFDDAMVATVGLTIDKQADRATFAAGGETINYTFTVTNSGSAILEGPVTVTDPLIVGVACPAINTVGNLDNFFDPGESVVCIGSYVTTATDVTDGSVDNTAFATVQGFDSSPDSVSVPLAIAALSMAKTFDSASPDPIIVGSVLTYTVTASNTGGVTLNNVVVSDPLLDSSPTTCATLAPDADCVLTGNYTVTQADVDNGELVNVGTGDSTETPPQDTPPVVTPIAQSPAIVLNKIVTSGAPYAAVNDVITYELTATNTGDVTLGNVSISDPDATLGTCTPNQPTILSPTESLVCEATYAITQSDIDAGSFTNEATVTAEDPNNDPVQDSDSATADGPATEGALEVDKALTGSPDPIVLGSVLEYTVTVTNTGNVTLTDVVVSDDLLTPDSETCASVLQGETCVLVGSYTVTQADVDNGEIVNVGTGDSTETPPQGTPPVVTPIAQSPAIVLDKIVTGGEPYADVDDVITYELTATNTGDVTLSNVSISDPDATLGTCTPNQPASLSPNESLVCEATYAVTQADIDAGSFTNEATVTALDPNNDPVGDTDQAVAVGTVAGSNLVVNKVSSSVPNPIIVGSVLSYTVTAINNGDVDLFDVVVSDSLVAIDPVENCAWPGPVGELGQSEQVVCAVDYTVNQGDIDTGAVNNVGRAEAPDPTDPTNPPIEDEDEVTTPIDQDPALSLVKELIDPPQPIVGGSTLNYLITATNIGNVTLSAVQIEDDMIVPNLVLCPEIGPGEECELSGSYVVTAADVQAGQILNTALANAQDSGGTPVAEVTDSVATTLGGAAMQPAVPVPGRSTTGMLLLILLMLLFGITSRAIMRT